MIFVRKKRSTITLSQVASATSTSATITGPAGITAGDLLVLWDTAASFASVPTVVVPTGFSSISNQNNGTNNRAILSAKIADGSEASASITGMNGDSANLKSLYVFRGSVPLTAFVANDVGQEITANNPSAQTCNASGGAVPLVVIGAYRSPGVIDPRTFTVGGSDAKDGEINPAATNYLAYKIYNSAPADVTIDMDDEGSINVLVSTYITVS
jgi:hypothetical protein